MVFAEESPSTTVEHWALAFATVCAAAAAAWKVISVMRMRMLKEMASVSQESRTGELEEKSQKFEQKQYEQDITFKQMQEIMEGQGAMICTLQQNLLDKDANQERRVSLLMEDRERCLRSEVLLRERVQTLEDEVARLRRRHPRAQDTMLAKSPLPLDLPPLEK